MYTPFIRNYKSEIIEFESNHFLPISLFSKSNETIGCYYSKGAMSSRSTGHGIGVNESNTPHDKVTVAAA